MKVVAGCGSCAFCQAVSGRVIADLYFAGSQLPLGVRQVVPKSVLGLKLLGIDEPGLQGPSLDSLCGPFVGVFLKQIETLPQSIG